MKLRFSTVQLLHYFFFSVVSFPVSRHDDRLNDVECPLCRPLCTHVEYAVETSVGVLNWDHVADGDTLMQVLSTI